MEQNSQAPKHIIERTRAYMLEALIPARTEVPFTETDGLLERGLIDSLGLVELIAFIQDEFGVQVAPDEITEETFGTLERIASYVLNKRAALASS
jgi:acyl carrier protein